MNIVAPLLFVVLWSTGFIGAKLGLPYAEPFTFLLLRFAIAAVLLLALVALSGAPWPRRPNLLVHSGVVGLLLHCVYIGGTFSAIHERMAAGLASLIAGLQPLVTAILGQALLRERIAPLQWLGLLLGLGGVVLVVGEPLILVEAGHAPPTPLALAMVTTGLLGGTCGTLYQRRFGSGLPLLSSTAIQFVAASLAMLCLSLMFETRPVRWTPEFIFALGWLVVVLSLGAILLLMALLRRNAAARVASLFYLVPPATALEAFVLFDERLGPLALAGMLITAVGVALVLVTRR